MSIMAGGNGSGGATYNAGFPASWSEFVTSAPVVGVLMGSSSDWETLQHAVEILAEFGVPYEAKVVSAHRMPDDMFAYAEGAAGRGLRAIIAGAGGAAHLPGMLAAKTTVPVHLRHRPCRGGQCGPVRGGDAGDVRCSAAHAARRLPYAPDRGRARHDAGVEVNGRR
jgi:hypothetical protein